MQESGKTVKIPDITPARRRRVNLRESIPEEGNEGKKKEEKSRDKNRAWRKRETIAG